MKFKSGFVTILGSPNAGKSTLLNTLLGEKIAAVSAKPQTTRTKVTGIITDDSSQIVLIDTPGIQQPKNKLGSYMKGVTEQNTMGADVLLYMIDTSKYNFNREIQAIKGFPQATIFLLLNKTDKIKKAEVLPIISEFSQVFDFKEIIPISAQKNEGTENLISCVKKHLPEGPKFFPDDIISDQPESQICAEFIREKMMRFLGDEVPYGTAVIIEKMEHSKARGLTSISAVIYCERQSHKAIIIGKDGLMLKKIATAARADIQRFLGEKVFLQLWVKVAHNWRNNAASLKSFNYVD